MARDELNHWPVVVKSNIKRERDAAGSMKKSCQSSLKQHLGLFLYFFSTSVSLLLWIAPTGNALSANNLRRSFKLRAPNLFPESFDWDPAHRRLLLGSAAHGTIWAFSEDDDGYNPAAQEFVRDALLAGKVASGGLIVDRAHNRVVIACQDLVAWKFGALAAFDLDTGTRLFLARLDQVGIAPEEPSGVNDVAVDFETGNAYVTNCKGNFIWKVTKEGKASVAVKHPSFLDQPSLFAEAPWCGFNGIIFDQRNRYLLAVQTNSGALFRIAGVDHPLPYSVHLVSMTEKLPGADGMVLRDDGALVVVSQEKVWLVRTSSDWMAAKVVDVVPLNASNYATGAAIVRGATFIVHAHLPDLFANRTRDEFEVVEIQFPTDQPRHNFTVRSLTLAIILLLIVLVVGIISLWRLKMAHFYERKRA